jgi:pyridinium-3,5-bisthiocarboxylic acid mononucleotide nickel chelatase
MKVTYIHCFAGISEEMLLGALVDGGLNIKDLEKELLGLNIQFDFKIEKIIHNNIEGSKAKIISKDMDKVKNVDDVKIIIHNSSLDKDIVQDVMKVFYKMDQVKTKGHINILSILYCCAILIGFKHIGTKKIYISPINVGQGFKKSETGVVLIPEKVTIELLKGFTIYSEHLKHESVTPLGASILSTIGESCTGMPEMKVESTAFGIGVKKDSSIHMLRILIGYEEGSKLKDKSIIKGGRGIKVETNIDDMNPQFYEYLSERLRHAGGGDIFLQPIYMKKNRPGNILCVTGPEEALDDILDVIFKETTTLGVKVFTFDKYWISYEFKKIETELGTFNVKLAQMGEYISNISPEYEECKQKALEYSVPIKYVYDLVKAEAFKNINKDNLIEGGTIGGYQFIK